MNRAALVFGLGASDAHAVNRNALYAVLYHQFAPDTERNVQLST